MNAGHPHLPAVEVRLCLGALPRREREILAHLLGCARCRTALAAAWDRDGLELEPESEGGEPAYGAAFERSERFARVQLEAVAAERAAAGRRLDDLFAAPPADWPAFFSGAVPPAFLALALDRARKAVAADPDTAEKLARLTRSALLRAAPEGDLPAVLRDELLARCWTVLGAANARRRQWARADRAFAEASRQLAGSPSWSAEEELCRFLAVRLLAEGREPEALALLTHAGTVAGEGGDVAAEIGALADRARLLAARGEEGSAAGALAAALLRAEDADLEQTAAQLRARLTWALHALGRHRDALAVAPQAEPDPEQRPLDVLVAAAIDHACRGELAFAESQLRLALAGARVQGDILLAVVAVLNLAGLYLRQGRSADLKSLASDLGVLADAPQIGLAARGALAELHRALRDETGAAEVLLLAAAIALDREAERPDPI